jgi:hypothetical protein
MLNLEHAFFKGDNKLEIFRTTSETFKENQLWAFDDGPFVANVDFLMTRIFDETYYSFGDIWRAEVYLMRKIFNSQIERLTTNRSFFKRFDIVGRNTTNRKTHLVELKKRFN